MDCHTKTNTSMRPVKTGLMAILKILDKLSKYNGAFSDDDTDVEYMYLLQMKNLALNLNMLSFVMHGCIISATGFGWPTVLHWVSCILVIHRRIPEAKN
jgi:hypothetical protein